MKYLLIASCWLCFFNADAQQHSLPYFLEVAKNNSPVSREIENQLLSIRLDSLLLQAGLHTQVNVVSNNMYAPVVKGVGYDAAITNGANASALVQASRLFISKNLLKAQFNSLQLQRKGLTDTLQIAEQELVRAITDQYITTYSDQVSLDLNNEILSLLSREEAVLKKLTRQSVYKQTDYLAFYVTLQQQQFTFQQSQIQYNADYLTLSYLAGVIDTVIYRVNRPNFTDSLPTNFAGTVFSKRFETDSLRLANERQQVEFLYKPRLSAYSDAGYLSSLANTPYKNIGVSVGVNLIVPIYDGHQKGYRYRQLNLLENTRLEKKTFYTNQYQQQMAQLTRQLTASDELVNTINAQVKYINTLLTANASLLETGDIKISDYVLAITSYVNARSLLNQNYVNRLRIVNQINFYNR